MIQFLRQKGWVDVRDVAKAHIIAFENEDAKIKEYC